MAIFDRRSTLQRSYDDVAEAYVQHIYRELDDKPADRKLLDSFAEALQESGPCIDLGCGPGHVTRYLHERGVNIAGIDLSAKMIKQARKLNPGIRFSRGNMLHLHAKANRWAAIVAFYSLIHVDSAALEAALLEFHRVLEPGGALLIAFHVGTETIHLEEWWEQRVDLDFHYHRILDMVVHLQQAGFEPISTYKRDPYPDIEAPTRRAYMIAEALPGIPPAQRK